LCPAHATDWLQAGKSVHPPERYEEGIVHSQLSAARPAQPQIPYRGNSTDVTALVSAVSGVMALSACVGLSWAVPLVAFGLGLSSWLQAKDAINPQRTRTLAVVGMAGAGLLLMFFLVMMFFCLLGPMLLALTSRPGPPPVATPFVFPTPTP
jgi:hypothetical protein